ncbi:MAG: alpha-amylase family glycosyl hydrolase, partial [Bacteroidota bacterium]|nr:alpha-amylase family glycosyl hydrolase [Bacteroidota bacterium]
MKTIYSAQNISAYDFFGTADIKGVERAVQTAENKITILINEDCSPDTINLFKITYNHSPSSPFLKEKLSGFAVEQKGNKIELIGEFNLLHNYAVEINGDELPVILDPKPGGILDTVFNIPEDTVLGAQLSDGQVEFNVWSPPAVKIKLILYESDAETVLSEKYRLKKKKNGLHTILIDTEDLGHYNLDGCFYQYEVYAYGRITRAIDPYSKSMAPYNVSEDAVGKSALIKLPEMNEATPFKNSDIMQDPSDVVAYEMHVRDFSSELGFTDKDISGTFSALGQASDYFADLGITHLQLMPVHKSQTQTDMDRRYSDYENGIKNYNWGYDPLNFFTLEGRYAVNPENPESRIKEFQEMSKTLHSKGIGLILDVVFNHMYSANTFENIAPGCYYRFTDDYKISVHTGAGPSLESRHRVVRKMIIDALIYNVKYLGADGFRFDLMEFTDKETLRQIREKVGKAYNPENADDLLLWGEAWEFKDINHTESFTKTYHSKGLNISMFNDVMRDSALGKDTEGGFLHGQPGRSESLAAAISGGLRSYDSDNFLFTPCKFSLPYNLFVENPHECLNFLSIHDGLTLWDKINLTVPDDFGNKRLRLAKQALLLLLTSQGRVILNGGDEILRSKPVSGKATNSPRVLTTSSVDEEDGISYFHENSYNSPDSVNRMRWSRLNNEFSEHALSLLNYVKGLIALRRAVPAFRYPTADAVNTGLKFIENRNENNRPKRKLLFSSFKSHKLKRLSFKFVNGPSNDILFLTGEIYKNEANPAGHPVAVKFDRNGTAVVKFSRKEIENFDISKWSNESSLDIKLVRTPGVWDTPTAYYSGNGSNSLCASAVDEDFTITVDLAEKDYSSPQPDYDYEKEYLAYSMKNHDPKSDSTISSVRQWFVIHNISAEELNFKHAAFSKMSDIK